MSVRVMVTSSIVGLSLGVGGVGLGAWAASPSPDARAAHPTGTAVHACVAKKGGAVRVASHCSRRERALRWTLGADLARGWQATAPDFTTMTATPTAIATLRLPSGNFRLEYTLTLADDVQTAGARCELAVDGAAVPATRTNGDVEAGTTRPMVATAIVKLPHSATVQVLCTDVYHGGSVGNGHLDGVRLGAVSGAWSPAG